MSKNIQEAETQEDQKIKDEGYTAFAQKKNMINDNPYSSDDPKHWLWRKGYLEAFQEANPPIW